MTKALHRAGGVAAVAILAAVGLSACGGSNSPHVASLGSSNGGGSGSTTTTLPKGNPTQLLDEWATCMRNNGFPNTPDPTIDANKVIHITMPASANGQGPQTINGGKENILGGGNSPCGAYLTAASTALRGGKPIQKPDPAKLEKFSQCMRSHGIPDFPDPNGGGLQMQVHPGSDLSPDNPTFQSASKLCAAKTGVPAFGSGTPQPGAIQASSGGPPGGGPGGNGGAGAGHGEVIQGSGGG